MSTTEDLSLEVKPKRGYAAKLLPEERAALIETLEEDILLQRDDEELSEYMKFALEDAREEESHANL